MSPAAQPQATSEGLAACPPGVASVPPTCDGAVALQGQRVVLAGAGPHQVQPAPAAGRREVADVLEGGADRSPGVRVGVVALHLHHIQSGACWEVGVGVRAAGAGGKGRALEVQDWGFCILGGEGKGG